MLAVYLYVSGLLILSDGSAGAASSSASPTSDLQSVDVACGPRCVKYTLDYYGADDVSVVELMRELQGPFIESGTSLAGIEAAIRRRGLGATAVQVDPGIPLDWDYPVILHLRSGEQTGGHFVVWLPVSRSNNAVVWNGLLGLDETEWSRLSLEMSGAALLTAPSAAELARARDSRHLGHWINVALIFAMTPGLWLLHRLYSRRGALSKSNVAA